jgi:radical SAM protein with 4Fe4S-binding SPASM domain
MIECKMTLTTECGAQCKTCPSWMIPARVMSLEMFQEIWMKLNDSPHVNRIILNNVGDLYTHPDHIAMLKIIENTKRTFVSMTTNGANMDYIPAIDELIISFNGGTKEAYEGMTGLDFDRVLGNIKDKAEDIRNKVKSAIIHCLICETNEATELDLIHEMTNFPGGMMFPGKIRFSYKYDNQFGEDLTLPKYRQTNRIYCDYLNKICVHVDGSVIMCAHDFGASTRWGNMADDSVAEVMRNIQRETKRAEHLDGKWCGLCEKCNHNMPVAGRIYEALIRE